ncbi:Clp protease N-terminal domain-containing protein [Streptomyces sp. NPDC058855]|uniref:Clp protease N-terminal domain-containing protein n=1 Tax=Streptomyces sp. NPDC058855 TaxID=3346651 RepID=UPI0036D19EA4
MPRAGTGSAVRLPRQPATARVDLAAGLPPALATVVTGARRRALRDGDRQIDTAHLLHALLESDPEAGAAFESGHQRARVLGYLVQRSIGYGLRWQRSVEESAARRALPAVRGAAGTGGRGSAWSPAAATVLEEAFRRAAARGEEHARGLDVLAVVATAPGSRAAEVLRGAGIDPVALAARAEERIASRVAGRAGDRIEGRSGGRIEALPAAADVPSREEASQQV